MYRETALLVALTAALVLAALIPVASLLRLTGTGVDSRLRFTTLDPPLTDLPIATPRITTPMLQDAMVRELSGYLLAAGLATALVALITLLMLWFARARSRSGEVGIRRAVGASRRVLLAASLLEGFVVFLVAAAVGIPTGLGLGSVAAATWPGTLLPAEEEAIGLVAGVVAIVVVVGAEFPAFFTMRRRVVEVEATPVAFFFPALMQLGLCLIALTTAALLVRHVGRPAGASAPLGWGGMVADVAGAAGTRQDRARGYARLLEESDHGTGASLTAPGTLVGLGPVARITTDCGECYEGGIYARYKRPLAVHHFVSADSFALLGIDLVAGRFFTSRDGPASPPVAVVSQSLANRYFQHGAPLGRDIQVGDDRTAWYTVVGIVADRAAVGFGGGHQPAGQVYLSVLQAPPVIAELLLPAGAAVPVGSMVRRVRPVADVLSAESAPVAWFGRWLVLTGLFMLLVAGVGVFAFARLWVLSLRPVLGLRRASGENRRRMLGWVLGRAALAGLAGVLVGAWFGPAVWLSLPELLPGLPAWDPQVMAGFAALLVLLMVLGALGPALSIAREPPAALIAQAEGT